ncbi:gliding motility protein RemB [Lacinutrix sp. MedPE-SW]|uniref:gliding motility protein RemB n=1 Tax=Lacinutrix sp. MedPE-SW TaxID=1860087 RepID=UPI000918894E|nr:gliding motility protein RemB [Lacinutrix sp. MedPE-SW]OIQ16658.1 MAG: gliding motility protein RemB [Lacinutrix sp. MedPE-SW]
MKHSLYILFFCFINFSFTQEITNEKPPVFSDCESSEIENLQKCFDNKVFNLFFENFNVPENVSAENYKGEVIVLFEIDTTGSFRAMYVDAIYKELKTEAERVVKAFPKVKPATYNGNPTFKQYSIALKIPLVDQTVKTIDLTKKEEDVNALSALELKAKTEFDSVKSGIVKYTNKAFKSQLNIPFTHADYSRFDRAINLIGTNSHTAAKPFIYNDVSNYHDFEAKKQALLKEKDTWLGRKLWNEHLARIQGKDYWFIIDPILDLEMGKDTDADFGTTYNNTRGVNIQGGLGDRFSFSAQVYESQGRFPQYFNNYAESLAPADNSPAVIPGRGIAKRFKTDAYDYPVAEAYLSYTPAKFINIQLGHGKNFIGDGYRSLLQSDVASPYPFFKLNTKFWKIKYTNTYTFLKDLRPEVLGEDGAFLTKYIANHYLSWNVNKRLNIGFFESVIWANTNNRGFDFSYLNPIIFYRAIEFSTGQDAGNAIIGFSSKYKWSDNFNMYGQFIIDEFSLSDVKAGNKSWKNKFGFQIGAKYYNAFKVKNLNLQLEYNQVRPYVYSHNTIRLNYAHNNQPMAHLWGANFRELVAIGRYRKGRLFGEAKFIIGERGFDLNNGTDNFNYGGDIFRDERDRPFDTGVEIGQGIQLTSIYASVQGGYIINPASNLKLFANVNYRNFNPEAIGEDTLRSSSVWFNLGLRTDLFNWYFDY